MGSGIQMVINCDLTRKQRRAFRDRADAYLRHLARVHESYLVIDCSAAAQLDNPTLGMFVSTARRARRRGLRVRLLMPSERLRRDLTLLGATNDFDYTFVRLVGLTGHEPQRAASTNGTTATKPQGAL